MLLPPPVRQTFVELAMETLRKKLLPRLMLLNHRKGMIADRALAQLTAPKLTVGDLQSLPIFHRWANLDLLIRGAELLVVNAGKFLLYETESTTDMFFLVQGALQVLRRPTVARAAGVKSLVGPVNVCFGHRGLREGPHTMY
jgi:hypothetical protein